MSIYPAWDDPYEEPSPEVPKIKTPVTNPGPKFRIEQISQEVEDNAFKVADLFSEIQKQNDALVARYRPDRGIRQSDEFDLMIHSVPLRYGGKGRAEEILRATEADPDLLGYLVEATNLEDEESAAHFAKSLMMIAAETSEEFEEISKRLVGEFSDLARSVFDLSVEIYRHHTRS